MPHSNAIVIITQIKIHRKEHSRMDKMTICKTCGAEIASSAVVCPKCGARNKKPFYKKAWFWIIIVVVVIFAAAGSSGGNKSTETASTKQEATSDTSNKTSTETTTKEEVVEKAPEEKVSKEFQNAYKKAESYYSMMHMSKAAIYQQLTSEYGEGFAEDAAQYAVDKLDETADWNDAALKKAQSYQDQMSMSKSAIYDQLVSEYGEQFTEEQAQYAIDNLPD